MNPIERVLRRVDATQQRRGWLAFPFAVVKKFGDDRAGYLAALIAYYGFFSVFPLLLVFVTVLGMVLGADSSLAGSIQRSALSQFPVIGQQIQVGSLHASGLALVVGIVGAVWAGMGVTMAAQNAMNEIWGVKMKDRPNFWISRLRSLIMLSVLGVFVLAATFLTGLAGAVGTAVGVRVVSILGSLVINLILFAVAFRVLTRRDLSWGDVFPGACFGAIAWTAIQLLGVYYIAHQVANARATYGTFAFVIGLLVWFFMGAQVTLYAAEINVVRRLGLWPRSLIQPPLTEADAATYTRAAKAEQRRPEQHVGVSFDGETHERSPNSVHACDPVSPRGPGQPFTSGEDRPRGRGRALVMASGLLALGVAIGRRSRSRFRSRHHA